jgi:hypothetical protein
MKMIKHDQHVSSALFKDCHDFVPAAADDNDGKKGAAPLIRGPRAQGMSAVRASRECGSRVVGIYEGILVGSDGFDYWDDEGGEGDAFGRRAGSSSSQQGGGGGGDASITANIFMYQAANDSAARAAILDETIVAAQQAGGSTKEGGGAVNIVVVGGETGSEPNQDMTLSQFRAIVSRYNDTPWRTKKGFDHAMAEAHDDICSFEQDESRLSKRFQRRALDDLISLFASCDANNM